MIYTIERANLITRQLKKFTDSYAFMVAGQFANIDFWIAEVVSAKKALDGHKVRFDKMYEAQRDWIEEKRVRVPDYCHICNGICELSHDGYVKPALPMNKARAEKKESRKELIDSAYYFLVRCHNIGLITGEEIKGFCDEIGTGIDPYDLK